MIHRPAWDSGGVGTAWAIPVAASVAIAHPTAIALSDLLFMRGRGDYLLTRGGPASNGRSDGVHAHAAPPIRGTPMRSSIACSVE